MLSIKKPLFEREIYSDGLSFDLLFEGYTVPRHSLTSSEVLIPTYGAELELERSTTPHVFGREHYCEVVKTSPGN